MIATPSPDFGELSRAAELRLSNLIRAKRRCLCNFVPFVVIDIRVYPRSSVANLTHGEKLTRG